MSNEKSAAGRASRVQGEAVAKIVNGNLAWNLASAIDAVPVGLLRGEHPLYTAPQAETLAVAEGFVPQAEFDKRLRVSIMQGDVIANHVIAMQAAIIEAAQVSPKEGLRWIFNTLRGPGFLPDMDEAARLGSAQAWFDAKTAEHEAFRAANPGPAEPKMVAVCCGRSECGGECGNEWQGEEAAPTPTASIAPKGVCAKCGGRDIPWGFGKCHCFNDTKGRDDREHDGADAQGAAQGCGSDAGASGEGAGLGANIRNEHRSSEAASVRHADYSLGDSVRLPDAGAVQEAIDLTPVPEDHPVGGFAPSWFAAPQAEGEADQGALVGALRMEVARLKHARDLYKRHFDAASVAQAAVGEWQPIETAPKDGERCLYLAVLDDAGAVKEIDHAAIWGEDTERLEGHVISQGYCWLSANGMEEPTHWAYQDGAPPESQLGRWRYRGGDPETGDSGDLEWEPVSLVDRIKKHVLHLTASDFHPEWQSSVESSMLLDEAIDALTTPRPEATSVAPVAGEVKS